MREVSEALRPSWKLAAGRLPWAWGMRFEEMFKGVPVGSRALLSAPEARRLDTPPMAACKEGAGVDEDFKQLSDEAPSEGLTTIPEHTGQRINPRDLCVSARRVTLCASAYMVGCTDGSGLTPLLVYASVRLWSEAAEALRLAWPPLPPGP